MYLRDSIEDLITKVEKLESSEEVSRHFRKGEVTKAFEVLEKKEKVLVEEFLESYVVEDVLDYGKHTYGRVLEELEKFYNNCNSTDSWTRLSFLFLSPYVSAIKTVSLLSRLGYIEQDLYPPDEFHEEMNELVERTDLQTREFIVNHLDPFWELLKISSENLTAKGEQHPDWVKKLLSVQDDILEGG